MILTKKQTKALDYLEDNVTTELVFGGGAGGGKSALGCYWALKMCLKYPGIRGVLGRAVLKTLKETTLNSFHEVARGQGLKNGEHYVYNAQSNIIKIFNGSEIYLKDLFQYPSDPEFDELGSLEITFAFVDECNQVSMKAWEVLKSRIRYKLDENGLIPKIMGSCNPAKNWVYNRFYKPSRDGNMPKGRAFVQSLATDNKYISRHYIDSLRSMTSEASKQRLLFGNWDYDNDPAALIPFQKIVNAFSNTFVEGGEKYITADIARYGRDKTVIGVWDGFKLIKIVTFDKNSVTQAAEAIKALMHEYHVPISNVIVDDDGVGGGVTDILGCTGFVNNSAPIVVDGEKENFTNLKSQCSYKLAQKMNADEIWLDVEEGDIQDAIKEELGQIKQKDMDKDGKKAIIPKEQVKEIIGRSPDYSDMIMMRMYFTLETYVTFTY